eukprot:2550399-Lingulodinium_polyedra.AAC.1
MVPGALFWQGVECKTWVWICRATFQRSSAQPLGDGSNPKTVEANQVKDKVTFIACLAHLSA